MKKTLLHFITGCVTRHEAKRFWRAFGDSEQEAKEFIQKIQKSYEPGNPLSGFFKHLTKKLFGLEKSPFDLSPEEIERLTRVVRDRSEDMVVRIELVDKLFEGLSPDPQEIEYKISDFYVKNKAQFDRVRDLEYDKEKNLLEVRTKKRIIANLLRSLGIKEEYVKKIAEGDRDGIPGLQALEELLHKAFREQQQNRSTFFPLHFDNSSRIDQLIKRLRG